MEYPSKKINYVLEGVTSRQNCRAWRVFKPLITDLATKMDVPLDEIFRFNKKGRHKAEVFACGSCQNPSHQSVNTYDLFDGQTPLEEGAPPIDIGLGKPLPPALRDMTLDERLAVSVVKMADASFEGYSSIGYAKYSGGGELRPNDFHGLAGMLLDGDDSEEPNSKNNGAALDENRLRAKLTFLKQHNPAVRECMTCLEREKLDDEDDPFPREAGGPNPLPTMPEPTYTYYDDDENEDDADAVSDVQRKKKQRLDPPGRNLTRSRFRGILSTVDELDETLATEQGADLRNQTVGTSRKRGADDMDIVYTLAKDHAPEDLMHTVLYYKGRGGWRHTKEACSFTHHTKARLKSVNPRFANAEEYIYAKFQDLHKRLFHNGKPNRYLPGNIVTKADDQLLAQQYDAAKRNAEVEPAAETPSTGPGREIALTPLETFTGGVAPKVVGGKRYWNEAFIELIAMAQEYGVPQFFLTFTANEFGWSDMKTVLDGKDRSASSRGRGFDKRINPVAVYTSIWHTG